MSVQPLNTGRLINSQVKSKAFYFDWQDPAIAIAGVPQPGFYETDCTFKNNSLFLGCYIKYFQDLSAYPAGQTINILDSSLNVVNTDTTPVANVPNQYFPCTAIFPPLNQIVAAGNVLTVEIGTPLVPIVPYTPLQFTFVVAYLELDF